MDCTLNKKQLILCLAIATIPVTGFAAGATTSDGRAVVSVDKCPNLAHLTSSEVKYIGTVDNSDLFIDASGNRVVPCKKDDLVHFYKVDRYPDGKRLFAESKNEVLNKDFYSSAINVDINTDTSITYGTPKVEVTDISDFQRQVQGNKVLNDNNTKVEFQTETYDPAMEPYLVPQDAWFANMPEEYESMTSYEKQELLVNLYAQVSVALQQKIKTEVSYDDFLKDAVDNNRTIKPTQKVLNQYDVDKEFEGKVDAAGQPIFDNNQNIQFGDVDGALYLRYKQNDSERMFLKEYDNFIKKQVTNLSYSVDQKLTMLTYLSKNIDEVDKLAKEFASSKKKSFDELAQKSAESFAKQGLEEYSKLSDEDKIAYNRVIIKINQEIIQKEYNSLPETINRKQYKALSNLDKYKYAPKKENGFVDRSVYTKNPLELVLKYEARK